MNRRRKSSQRGITMKIFVAVLIVILCIAIAFLVMMKKENHISAPQTTESVVETNRSQESGKSTEIRKPVETDEAAENQEVRESDAETSVGKETETSAVTEANQETESIAEAVVIDKENGDVIYNESADHVAYDADSQAIYFDDILTAYFFPEADDSLKEQLAEAAGGEIVGHLDGSVSAVQIKVQPSSLEELNQKANQLMEDDSVIYAGYDFPEFSDARSAATSESWENAKTDPWSSSVSSPDSDIGDEENPGGNDWGVEAIKAYTAWQYENRSVPVNVGIVDEGVDFNHRELNGRTSLLPSQKSSTASEHGTHVAGIIGAEGNNGEGIHGIDGYAHIICADCTQESFDSSLGYTYFNKELIENGAKVVNISRGGALYSKIKFADILMWDTGGTLKDITDNSLTFLDDEGNEKTLDYKNKNHENVTFYKGQLLWLVKENDYEDFQELAESAIQNKERVLLNLENGQISEAAIPGKYGTVRYVNEIDKQGAYEAYRSMIFHCCQISSMHAIIPIVQMILSGNSNFLIVQSAGNGYLDRNKGIDTSYNGAFCTFDQETWNLFSEDTRRKLESRGITYQSLKEHILIVGSVANIRDDNGNYQMSSFSNYGKNVDICAPGEGIYSTLPGNTYGLMDGTSMAAPMVTGSLAYLWSLKPDMTAPEVKKLLISSATVKAIGVQKDKGSEYPMLNLGAAVTKLMEGDQKESESTQTITPESHAAGSGITERASEEETQAAGTTARLQDLVWSSDPLDIDRIYDIAYQNLYGDDYLTEKTGYGPTWEMFDADLDDKSYMTQDAVYSPDGVIFEKDGIYGVMNFTGDVLIDGLAGNTAGAYNPSGVDLPEQVPYSCTGWGISLDENAVLSTDYTWEHYSSEIPDLLTGGDAGIVYVSQDGILKAGIIGDSSNPSIDYQADWASYIAEEAIVLRVNDTTGKILGSARVNTDGSVAYITDYPLYNLDDARGYANGFYVTSFYSGDFSIAREFGQEQDSSGYGLVNAETGERITKRQYQAVKWFEDGYCPVKLNDRWGFIDEDGNEVTDFLFEDASALYQGKAYVKMDGAYRILDLSATLGEGTADTTGDTDGETSGNSGVWEEENGWRTGYASQLLFNKMDDIRAGNIMYFLDDMNNDGVPELGLIYGEDDYSGEKYFGGSVTIYTWTDNQVLNLGDYGQSASVFAYPDEGIIISDDGYADLRTRRYYQIDLSAASGMRFLDSVVAEYVMDDTPDGGHEIYYTADEEGNAVSSLTEDEYDEKFNAWESDCTVYDLPEYIEDEKDYFARAVPFQELTEERFFSEFTIDGETAYADDSEYAVAGE